MYHNLVKCASRFLAVLFVFIALAASIPAQAQDGEPIDMLKDVVLTPDQCSPGCMNFAVHTTCFNGSTPQNMGNTYFMWDLSWNGGANHEGGYLPHTGLVGSTRTYSRLIQNYPTGTYYAKYTPTTGGWAWQWSGLQGPFVLQQGGYISVNFYRYMGGGEGGCP